MHARARTHWAALACLATVLTGTTVLAGAVTDSAEAATGATCTTRITGATGAAPAVFTAQLAPSADANANSKVTAVTVDIDVTTDTNKSGNWRIQLKHGGTTRTLKAESSGGLLQPPRSDVALLGITFDDSATTPILASTGRGRHKPSQALGNFDGRTPSGPWTLDIANTGIFGSNQETGTVRSWSAAVTHTCDDDNDGVRNSRDNCPDLANRSQADRDKDGVGDACDPDVDGDGVPNATDNCPQHPNANQRDMDGDGAGDPCDDDADADGFYSGDECPLIAANTDSGCPEVKRKVTAKFKPGKRVLTGKVKANRKKGACQRRTTVRLYRGSKFVARTDTNKRGRYTFRLPSRKGKYYAFVPFELHPKKAKFGCFDAQSKKFKVKARR